MGAAANDPSDLKGAAARGVAWKVVAEVVNQVTRLVLLLVLTHLLVPSEFGIASIVLAFAMFVPVLADLGLGAALIQAPKLTELDTSTVFWTSLPVGTGFMLLGIGASFPMAEIFHEPTLQPLFAVYSVSFLLASLASVPSALLLRAMNFRVLELRVIAGTLCGAAAAIALAFAGFGPWALVGGELANRGISVVMLWLSCHWRPRLMFSRVRLRAQMAYGGALLGAHLLMQFSQTIQALLIGRTLGTAALGRFTVAQTLVYVPFNRVAAPIQEVMFPTFSRMQDEPRRIMNALNRINQVVAAISFPALGGLAVLAPEFTDLVLGPKWHGTEPVLRILALAGMAVALQRVNFSVLSARGYARSVVWVGLGALVSVVAAILVGYRFGLTATVAALAVQAFLLQTVLMTITAHSIEARLVDLARPLGRIAAATCVMVAAVWAVAAALRSTEASDAVVLAAGIATGAAVFLVLLVRLESELIRELRGFARGGARRRGTETSPSLG
jgi:PST family polysaccharide transporter